MTDSAASDSAETQRLLDLARAGERQACGRLFSRHRSFLHQVVRLRLDPRVLPRVDPSDVVQDAHTEALRRLPQYLSRPVMPFRLWLRQLAYDRVVMATRRHVTAERRTVKREVPLSDHSSRELAAKLLARGASPVGSVSRRELVEHVRRALAKLPAKDSELLLMRNVEGLSGPEVALVLGIEPAAARQRYGRALLRLRRYLIEDGFGDLHL